MNLLLKTEEFTLSISPLFKATEGKHTIQFITKEENEKPVHETFLLDYNLMQDFVSNFLLAYFSKLNNTSADFEIFMHQHAPRVWNRLLPF